jgi:type I restriction enzyme S subunit
VAGWSYPVLGDICDVRDGTHDSPKYIEEGYPLITSKNLIENGLSFEKVSFISKAAHDAIEKRSAVSDGDILYGMIGTVGNPVIVKKERDFSVKNVAIFKFKEESLISNKYLFHVLSSDFVIRQIGKESKGGTQKFVSLKVLRGLQIPLPPLETQKKIAVVLEKAAQLRKDCQQMEQELNSLAQSVFMDMFIGNDYPLVKLEDLASKRKHALSSGPFGSALSSKHYTENGVLVLRGLNTTKGKINLTKTKYVSKEKAEELKRSKLTVGDIVIIAVGTSGFAISIPDGFPEAVMSQNFNKISPDFSLIVPKYLEFAINSPFVQHQFSREITDTVRTFLSLTKLKSVEIPLPPISKQKAFLNIVNAISEQEKLNKKKSTELNDCFTSLMQKAFKGELNLNNIKV